MLNALPKSFTRGVYSKAVKKLRSAEKKKKNLAFQQTVESKREKVDPVLGRPNNAFITRLKLEIEEPDKLAKNYKIEEVDKLLYGAKKSLIAQIERKSSVIGQGINNNKEEELNRIEAEEKEKRDILMRILSLRNADQQEKSSLLRRLAVKEFERFEGDTGSSEVQAAVMSIEINNLMLHIKSHPQDLLHIRKVRMLTQKRQRILRYLKADNPQRYFWTIAKLGLTDESVHMEFNFDRQYCDDFDVWPGRKLVRITKKDNEQLKKDRRLKKQQFRRALNETSQSDA